MLDTIMMTLFVLFMIWLINGFIYNQMQKHQQKMQEREEYKSKNDKKK